MSLKSINPYTNQLIEEFDELTDESTYQLILQTSDAFEKWRKTSHEFRRSLMLNVSDLLRAKSGKLARSITEEMGKILKESIAEVEKCAWVCDYYAEKAEDFLKAELVATDARESYVLYEPIGTVLGIMPWNFPFWQVFRFTVPTLMAGNTVVLKHASNVQRCGKLIEEIFLEAGFPPSVFRNLAIGSGHIANVVENDAIKAVSLTGSELAGQKVAETSGRKIKKTVLELGGSNAFIILEDADIEKAVETGITSRMQNAGQSCIAAKRFIVDEKVSERFIALFREKVKNLKYGDPMKDETSVGPLCSIEQAKAVEKQVRASVEMGAQIVEGGYPQNALYPPTLVVDVRPGMPLFDEEVFGPVAPVIIAKDVNEAVRLSNNTRFGLGVNLFTNNIEKAKELAHDFEDGAVFVNAMVKSDPRLPFGGTKKSGYGRELGAHGIREFVNMKTVFIR
jgi:succinate-semialdehyde dehydrogenase/glutarate-semialdehyde dehydrogenase